MSAGPSMLAAIERFDLEEYIIGRGADPEQNEEWALECPICLKPKLIVNVKQKTWHCWVCEEYETVITSRGAVRRPVRGAGGLLDLIQFLEGCARRAAIEVVLRSVQGVGDLYELPQSELAGLVLAEDKPAPTIPFPGCVGSPLEHPLAQAYLEHRRITPQDVVGFGLFWCWGGRYRDRLVFPVWEEGRFVYFQARAMWTPQPGERFIKALNPSSRDGGAVSTEVLMNLDRARRYRRVAVVEGPMDCLRTGETAVCTFGKAISGAQIAKLLRAGVRAIDLMWDGPSSTESQGARKEMLAAAPMLKALFDLRLVFLPQGDPADYVREELNWFRSTAAVVSDPPSKLEAL